MTGAGFLMAALAFISLYLVLRGAHHDLLHLGGLYRRMWDLQNRVLLEALPAPLDKQDQYGI